MNIWICDSEEEDQVVYEDQVAYLAGRLSYDFFPYADLPERYGFLLSMLQAARDGVFQ